MRTKLAISFVVQGILFLGVLVAIYHYGVSSDLPLLNKPASTGLLTVTAIGLFESIVFSVYLFSKADIKNDGKLVILYTQAAFLPFVFWQSWLAIFIIALPSVFMFAYWLER